MYMFLWLVLLVLFTWSATRCEGVQISSITVLKIKRGITLFEKTSDANRQQVGSLLLKEWPASRSNSDGTFSTGESECKITVDWYTSPAIILWDVIHSHPEVIDRLSCPFCLTNGMTNSLRRSGNWADTTWTSSMYEPRVVYVSSYT
jgi:hypothetical protein